MLYKVMMIALFIMLNIHYISGEGSVNSPNNDGTDSPIAANDGNDGTDSPIDALDNDNNDGTDSPTDDNDGTDSPLDGADDDNKDDGDDEMETTEDSHSGSDSNGDGNSDSSDDPNNDSQSGEESNDNTEDEEAFCLSQTAQSDCLGITDDAGYMECGYNADKDECYSVEQSQGTNGWGTYDDGYNAAYIQTADDTEELETLVGILGGIIAVLVLVIGVGGYWICRKQAKENGTRRAQSLEVVDVESNGQLISTNN
eukprot:192751_1